MTKNVNEYLVYNKYKTRATKHEPTNYNRLQKEFNERQEHGRDIKQHGTWLTIPKEDAPKKQLITLHDWQVIMINKKEYNRWFSQLPDGNNSHTHVP